MFITLEGPEGSGKSTQAQLLYRYLCERNKAVVLTREPGGTLLGDKLRAIVMFGKDMEISPRAELLLFTAARAQLVDEIVRPALARGDIVICDRYADSTVAYQGYGRGLPIQEINAVNHFATAGLVPDLTFLLDIPPEVGLTRNREGQLATDRFETEEIDFHARIREGYLEIARSEPKRWVIVDATQPIEKVWADIREAVEARLQF